MTQAHAPGRVARHVPGFPLTVLLLLLLAPSAGLSQEAAAPPALQGWRGFLDPTAIESQRRREERLDASIDPARMEEWMRRLASHPHHVGSPGGKANAEFLASLFREWGYETRIETFHVLFPTPIERSLVMTAPKHFKAALAEERATGRPAVRGGLPSYNAYSIDGTAEGEVVYVNHGLPADYEALELRGISVRGRIALARYGGTWRGLKPKLAAEHGAIACVIYSDPREDGYFAGDVLPEGGFRPASGVQRGSVLDMVLHPGDPLTPFVAATDAARPADPSRAATLTRIPVLPISAADALPILEALAGPVAPEAWRGALPVTYHLGPGPARVRLTLRFRWELVPAHDVIAVLPGAREPDSWIVRGNHHDAWVLGATDPVSGLVALMDEARAVAAAARVDPPARTIVYAAWDAEEQGLIGSTEWVERHAEELAAKGAVYINSDSNSRGFLGMGGSHALEVFMNEIAAAAPDPLTGKSVGERLRAATLLDGTPAVRDRLLAGGPLPLDPLGSGSDFTPFLQHLGIASLNLGFGGEGSYGQYHSDFDDIEHHSRFMDPGFAYAAALARTAGRVTLRLAWAELLPFEFSRLATRVGEYADEIASLWEEQRRSTEITNQVLAQGAHELARHPEAPLSPPRREEPVPYLNFAPLRNSIDALAAAAARYEEALRRLLEQGRRPAAPPRLEAVLRGTERALTWPEGLPDRPWYRHQIYAPGRTTGYGVKTLPGVREAIEERDWRVAEEQIGVVAGRIEALSGEIVRAAELLEAGP